MLVLLLYVTGAVRAEITAAVPYADGDTTWLVCTDQAKDKTVSTTVRRLADPLRGIWVDALHLVGRVLDAAPLDDRLALLAEDGSWRVAWDGTSVGGPKPPERYTLRQFDSSGGTLWAIASGPNDAATLLKWREQEGWSVEKPLPEGVTADRVSLGVVSNEPWIAFEQSATIRLMRFTAEGWQAGLSANVPELTNAANELAIVAGAPKPLLMLRIGDTGATLLDVGLPQRLIPLPHAGEAVAAGPVLKLFRVKDGKIEQTTIDDRGFGQPFGPAVVADPARPLPPRGEWLNPLILAILTVLTLRALRPQTEEPVSVAGSLTPAPIVRRFAAVVIDAGPCVAIGIWAYAAFGGTMEELPRSGLPAILAGYLSLLGYLAHVAACEMAFGRSLGKWLLGLRVVSIDGNRASPGQILMRNLLRLLEIQLFLPMFIVLMTPTGQRMGDLAARTMVTIDTAGPALSQPDDQAA